MFTYLINTIKKNTYEVMSDDNETLMVETNGDIDATSEIFEKENNIEKLTKESRACLELIGLITDDLSFIKKINGFLILFLVLTPLTFIGFSELTILNTLIGIGDLTLIFAKIVTSAVIGTKSKLNSQVNKLNYCIHLNREKIDTLTKEVQKLKGQLAYQELNEIPQLTLSELPVEQRSETIQIRKLTKAHINE